MRAIAQFIVRVFDLFEAEGAALLTTVRAEASRVRSVAVQLAMGLALLAVAVPVILTGCGLVTIGLFWLLDKHLDRWLAATLTGTAILAVGVGLVLVVSRLMGSRKP